MAVFQVQTADGRRFEVRAPDQQSALASLEEHTKSPSMTEGLGRAFATGVPILGGLVNKADAATNALLAPYLDRFLPDDYEKLPEGTFAERYHHALDFEEGKDRGFEAEHPKTAAGAEIGGGIASTLATAGTATGAKLLGLTAKTLPGMMARGAVSGATINAADAAVRGEDPAIAAGIGGVAGVVAPAAGRLINAATTPVRNVIRGARDPVAEAERRVAAGLDRDIKLGGGGLPVSDFMAARDADLPVTLMDVGGETTRALARSAANTSPEGRAILSRTIDERFAAQAPRLAEWLQRTFHYPDAEAQSAALDRIARTVNRPAYARAFSDPNAQVLWDEGFQQLTAAPVVQDAIRAAAKTGANKAAIGGFRAPVSPFQFAADGTMRMKEGVKPSLQFWDAVKRNLDDKIGTFQRSGEREAAKDALQLKNALVLRLDQSVPNYANARAGAARFFGAQDAIEAGQNFVGASQRFGIPGARRALASMSKEERQLFQDGYVSRLVEKVEKTGDRRSVLNQIAQSPAARVELNVALGPERAKEVEARLRVECIMDLARPAIQGNSTTARQLVEVGLAGGADVYEGGGKPTLDKDALLTAALVYGAARSHRVIDERVAAQVARLLTSSNMNELTRGLRIVTRNQNLFRAIRNVDAGLAAIAARGATPTVSRQLGAQ